MLPSFLFVRLRRSLLKVVGDCLCFFCCRQFFLPELAQQVTDYWSYPSPTSASAFTWRRRVLWSLDTGKFDLDIFFVGLLSLIWAFSLLGSCLGIGFGLGSYYRAAGLGLIVFGQF